MPVFPSIFSRRNNSTGNLMQRSPDTVGDLLDWYNLLEYYYHNNGLYEALAGLLGNDLQPEALAALRTPAKRVVEFYAGTIWPGSLPNALPIKTDNPAIIDPIKQVWAWSNWGSKKQLAIRRFAMFGDLIIKVARRDKYAEEGEELTAVPSSVYMETINPKHIPENGLLLDERGNVIYARIDIPKHDVNQRTGRVAGFTHTEVWTLEGYRRFRHSKGIGADLNQLGQPLEEIELRDFGIDFIPLVYAPFRAIDDLARGMGAYSLDIEKINELNRMATRLHYLLFRYDKPIWALSSNMVDGQGRPIIVELETDRAGKITVDEDDLLRLPGNASLEALVANLDYDQYLKAITEQSLELEKDLPELAYSRLREKGDLSGRAISLLLGDAIGRAVEARGNAEEALAKAHKMALTLGDGVGLFGGIGTYEAGSFDHEFIERDIIQQTEIDRAETAKGYIEVGLAVKTALRRAGWEEKQIDLALEELKEQKEADQTAFASATLQAARDFDSGAASNGMETPEAEEAEEAEEAAVNEE